MINSWKTFVYFICAYPLRGMVMVICLTLAGLLEGIGIMVLLPLIGILIGQDTAEGGVLADAAAFLFSIFRIEPDVLSALLFIVGAMGLKAAANMLAVVQIARTSAHVAADLRLNYIQGLLHARWAHYVENKSGAVANAIGTEAQRAAVAFKQGCQVFAHGIQVLVYAALALLLSWKLTLAAVCAGGMMVLLLGFLTREARRSGKTMTDVYNDVLSLITDSFYGAKPLKAMSRGNHLFRLLEKNIRDLQSAQRRLDIADQGLWALSEFILVIFVAGGLYGALTFTSLPLTELLFMAVLFLRMVTRISSAQRAYQSMASNESAMWSLRDKTDAAVRAGEDLSGTREPVLEKDIVLDDVSFAYQEESIIKNLSLTFSANQLHAVFGPSGTGKTTLVDLIIGLHRPTGGSIRIDGIPLDEVDLKQWRQRIGYVPQDVFLFHDTILNNLTLNAPDFDEVAVEKALKMAGAWDFVQEMEEGIHTIVGERGSRLSGGQRQRIAIARAILSEPLLLILDEATSALDPETEQQILKTVKALSGTMTVLAISHNPAILDVADNVVQLERDGDKA